MKDFVVQEDVRKLHNEINQLSNQRFLLVTLSITVFIGFIGAVFPKDLSEDRGKQTITICLIFQLFTFFISTIAHSIRHISRCEATYLIAKDLTEWEQPWNVFRERKTYSGFSYVERMIYPALLFAASIIPVLFAIIFDWKISCWHFLPVLIAAVALFTITSRQKKYTAKEKDALDFWHKAILVSNEDSGEGDLAGK